MNAVKISDLQLFYGSKHILHGVSFEAEQGDFFTIIGPNGTGKTTLLKAIAGLVPFTAGTIEILGRPLASYARKEFSQQVAVVPQHVPAEFPFKVSETVLMGRSPHLRLWEMERREDHHLAEKAMLFTDVAHLADRRLDQLSGGERQRVYIARAICQQPRLLLLDEPTASLDPAHQIKILDLMERLRSEQKVTVVMVSHDLNLAAMYGNRLLLLTQGAVESVGPPGKVLTYERLERSYGCLMLVDESPLGAVPRVVPVPEKYRLPRG